MSTDEKDIRERFTRGMVDAKPVAVVKKPKQTPRPSPTPQKRTVPQVSDRLARWTTYSTDSANKRAWERRRAEAMAAFPDIGEEPNPEIERHLARIDAENREYLERVASENAKELREAGRDDVVAAHEYTLTKENPEVSLVARPWEVIPEWQRLLTDPAVIRRVGRGAPRLTVTGLGPYTGKRRARLGLVDMTIFDLSNRIVEVVGITSDGDMILPDIAARVYFRLRDRKKTATASLDRHNRQLRDDLEPVPAAWLAHQMWTPPKGDEAWDLE